MILKKLVIACGIGALAYGMERTAHWVTTRYMNEKNTARWARTSFRGTPVSLLGGLEVATASAAACVPLITDPSTRGIGLAAATAGIVGGAAGYVDDHLEDQFPAQGKGFAGHIGALRQGNVTSGLVKIAAIGTGSLVASVILSAGHDKSTIKHRYRRSLAHFSIDSMLIAGTANLVNLLDLRPGRALKTVVIGALPYSVASLCGDKSDVVSFRTRHELVNDGYALLSASIIGTACAGLPSDLAGDTMLGDLGANAIGAQLGVLIASRDSLAMKSIILTTIVALTLASEKVSFSRIISNNRILNALDKLGSPVRDADDSSIKDAYNNNL